MSDNPTNSDQPHKHIPALDPARLKLALQDLEALPLTPKAKRQLAAMLKAAANPDAESPEAVIASMETERKQNIMGIQAELSGFSQRLRMRGTSSLMGMDDAEFNHLVDEANAE